MIATSGPASIRTAGIGFLFQHLSKFLTGAGRELLAADVQRSNQMSDLVVRPFALSFLADCLRILTDRFTQKSDLVLRVWAATLSTSEAVRASNRILKVGIT